MGFGRKDYDDKHLLVGIDASEPVFLLRAQDKEASIAVREYAHRLRLAGGPEDLIESAWAQANLMEAWHIKKVPDLFKDKEIKQMLTENDKNEDDDLVNMG